MRIEAEPPWAADVLATLAAGSPVPVERLAEQAGVVRGMVQTFLERQSRFLETGTGWLDLARLADRMAFAHELRELEREADVLAADDDLAVLALLVADGLPLATGGGEVVARAMPDLSAGLPDHLPAGGGLIGQALVGPAGWLAQFRPGDLLRVELRDGRLAVAATEPPAAEPAWVEPVRAACAVAAEEALDAYADSDDRESPAASIPHILAELLLTEPGLVTDLSPPLGTVLRAAGWETFGGHVGVPGTAWNLGRARRLSRPEVVAGTRVLRRLLAWDDGDLADASSLLDGLMTSREVVRYLADEVERRVAVENASLAPILERLVGAVRNPAERAAVTLLRARAAEGAADSITAERLVHQALADLPDLVPAVMDAGEYAACRGDLRDADDYLRRADHPAAGDLRKAIGVVLDAPAATGRNQPCPCGSGRKYKLCCLTSGARPLTVRAPLCYALLATFGQRSPYGDRLGALIHRSGAAPGTVMLCLDLALLQDGFTDRFLRARGDWLRGDERELFETWSRTPITLYEIRNVRRGTGVTMRILPGGAPFFQRDRRFSTSVRRLDLLCGRLLTDGTQQRILALPTVVPRDLRREALDLFAAGQRASQIATFLGPQPDPYVVNADGHDLVDSELILEVPDVGPAWRRLTGALAPIDNHILEHHVEVDGKTVSRGRVTRLGGRLKVSANSVERLAELEDRVRAIQPEARELSRRHERMGGEPPNGDRPVRKLVFESYLMPEVAEDQAEAEMLRRSRESWLDTPNRDGVTPREAAKLGGEALAELEATLDDMRWHNERNLDAGKPITMDVDGIRRDLGLPA